MQPYCHNMSSIFPSIACSIIAEAWFPADLCVVSIKKNVCELDEENYSCEFVCFCSFTCYETIFLAEIFVGQHKNAGQ